ncbi:MAG: MBOAT family protein [Clostridia bacterium]|nr:MBOAT family protein [Clostridia bacterium]
MVLGIIANIGLLFTFKYTNFMITNLNSLLKLKIKAIKIILPLGISFFTFQNISYLVDIYKGKIKPDKNIINFTLYTCYFPRIVNGPIMRYESFINEISNLTKPNLDKVYDGTKRLCFGLGKVLILSFVVGNIWTQIIETSNSYGITVLTAWLGIICYSLYLFLNFSGYIDISIGISKMFGIELPENFDYPYYSTSISEFWRRWHITLGSWFRDYIYIPLGGNRKGNVYFNLMVVFILTGLWHGSSWNFIVWGLYNGIFIVIERFIREKAFYKKIPNVIKRVFTYLIILLGWVLFACNGLMASIHYYKYLFGLKPVPDVQYSFRYFLTFYNAFFIILSVLISLPIKGFITSKIKNKKALNIVSGVLAVVIFAISVVYLINSSYSPSLYAQF